MNKTKNTTKKKPASKKREKVPGCGRKNKYTTKQMIDAIEASAGYLTFAARSLGCDYHTVQSYIRKFSEIAECYNDILERNLDIAENVVINDMKSGSVETAKWFLKYKGKPRGYYDRDTNDSNAQLVSPVPETKKARDLGLAYLKELTDERSNG